MGFTPMFNNTHDFLKQDEQSQAILPKKDKETEQQGGESSGQFSNQPLDQSINRLTDRTTNQVNSRVTELSDYRTTAQQINLTAECQGSVVASDIDSFYKTQDLNYEIFRLLRFIYFNRPFKVQSRTGNAIGDLINPGMTVSNVRNRIMSLVKKGYIQKPFSINNGIIQGSTCKVNLEKCIPLFGLSIINENEQQNYRSREPQSMWSTDRLGDRALEQPRVYNSSSFKNTTTIETIDMSSPVLIYWQKKGLSEKRIKIWMKEFNLSLSSIIIFLEYAAFDLDNNQKEKNIRDGEIAWFYGALKKGGYCKPKNFKSFNQVMIEKEDKELEIMNAEVKRLGDLRKQKIEIMFNFEFEKMMNDPEGELYKKCFELFPIIQKKRFQNPSAIQKLSLEREMKIALKKTMGYYQDHDEG